MLSVSKLNGPETAATPVKVSAAVPLNVNEPSFITKGLASTSALLTVIALPPGGVYDPLV